MFDNTDEIYNHIGQSMFNALPEDWDAAWLDVNMSSPDRALSMGGYYQVSGSVHDFDVNVINGKFENTNSHKAFHALYKIMKKHEVDVPWNKVRFEVTPDGNFEIQFKYDDDYAWYQSLDIDSEEYDKLDIDIINQIKTWEGLPESAERYWKQ